MLAITATLPLYGFSQSVAGTYTNDFTMTDGSKVTMTMEVLENGNFSIDQDGDGTMDVYSKYEIEGDMVTIWSVSGSDCSEKGKYKFEVTEKAMMVEVVEDPCESRIPPGGKATWKRK